MDVATALSAFLAELGESGQQLAVAVDDLVGASPDCGVMALARLRTRLEEIYVLDGWEPPESSQDHGEAEVSPPDDPLVVDPTVPSIDESRAVLRARAHHAVDNAQVARQELSHIREQFEILRNEVQHMRSAMRNRAAIEQAKGIVMGRFGIPADAAWHYLVRQSQTQNVKVRDLAQTIVAGAAAGEPTLS